MMMIDGINGHSREDTCVYFHNQRRHIQVSYTHHPPTRSHLPMPFKTSTAGMASTATSRIPYSKSASQQRISMYQMHTKLDLQRSYNPGTCPTRRRQDTRNVIFCRYVCAGRLARLSTLDNSAVFKFQTNHL